MQGPRQGVGPLYQRRYTVRIAGSPLTAAELIDRVAADLNAASPVEVAVFDKTSGASRPLAIGDEYVVHMPGPWNCPVRVVERAPASFRLVTLSGHLEAGEIEFRVDEAREDGLVFIIESWARSGDRLAEILYEGVGIAKEMQLHMWTHFCTRVAELSGGTMIGDVEVQTERVDVADAGQGQQLVEHAVTAAFARTFALAARLRDRPLHPKGLVFDAALVLHGTSQHWGVPFLDERTELRGEVRLSRAIGLPPPLPDLLGLALRWRQPSTGDAGAEATAELLLATTGHTTLGRHLLRPATHWSPTFYGSLLAYQAGDRRILLGAVARRHQTVPADLAALARSVDEQPLLLDLVVATGFGPWERFGELRILGPARGDDHESMRFNPARNPIRGLPPAGLFQQVRGPTYDAVQHTARRTGDPRPAQRRQPERTAP
ncbi:DUF1990 family protein [Actinomadura sp. BRA 177]|uniref:DUF1990 family protein n=1 Tax=Actinomadura sp. BRA 177 TaxID=2745202 RepID=UPI001595C04C|nr:DUF1990 family protein [Actinomadura sp. BRA 177]